MKSEFWHNCWQKNSIGFHQEQVHPFLDTYLKPLLLPSDQRVFVPLCGKSLDMAWLAENMQVVGAELSEIACADFFNEKNLAFTLSQHGSFTCYQYSGINLWQGDFFQLASTDFECFNWIYDRAALIALPETMQQAYVNQLKTFFADNTRLFLLTLEFPTEQLQGPPFAVDQEKVHSLFNGFNIELLASRELPDKQFAQRTFNVDYLTEKLYLITQ